MHPECHPNAYRPKNYQNHLRPEHDFAACPILTGIRGNDPDIATPPDWQRPVEQQDQISSRIPQNLECETNVVLGMNGNPPISGIHAYPVNSKKRSCG
jgi:hypothetical protein